MRADASTLHSGGRILAVDDQPENLELVDAILSDEGFVVELAGDGEAALEAVQSHPPDCIVLDIMMPRLDGFSVCHRLKSDRRTHHIPIVMLTALSEVDDKVTAFEVGADDFLNKPVHAAELVARVRSLVKIKRLHDELDSSESIIVSMVQALESKAPRSAGHSQRVAVRAVHLARRLGLEAAIVENVAKGAVLHDLGKLGVPERLLWRSELDGDELDRYRSHPILGEQILAPLRSFDPVRRIVRNHHERLDGSGYPDGLVGHDLNLEQEIVALANLFDNLANTETDREAIAERLRREAVDGRFHRDLVEELLQTTSLDLGTRDHKDWIELIPTTSGTLTGRIVVADDTRSNLEVLQEVLGDAGHEVHPVSDARSALKAVEELQPDLVLFDVNMPDMDGFTACRALKEKPETQFLPVVLITAYRELRDRTMAAMAGADDFLLQPINSLELTSRVKSLLRLRRYFRDLEQFQDVILSLASALEAKDPYTRGHSERVGSLAKRLALQVGLPEDESHQLLVAGQLHDIGKIGVPEGVLNKNGRLTDDEFELIKYHPVLGEEICQPLRSVRHLLPVIRHHHEKYDGSGYPDGLAGEDIPLTARILSMADAYDALTSPRPYRGALERHQALELLEEETGQGRWDKEIFETFSALVRETPS